MLCKMFLHFSLFLQEPLVYKSPAFIFPSECFIQDVHESGEEQVWQG